MHRRKIKISSIHDSDRERKSNKKVRNASKKLLKKRRYPNKCNPWKVLKTIVFVFCLIFFFYQSTSFLTDYLSYPTTARYIVSTPKQFKMPCITFCNSNLIKRRAFCSEFPHLCEAPNNTTDFCSKHPHMCMSNISNLVIPKLGEYTSDARKEIRIALEELSENRNMSQKVWGERIWNTPQTFYSTDMTLSLAGGMNGFGYWICYSGNLRFSNNLTAKLWPNTGKRGFEVLEQFTMRTIQEDESFYPSKIPQIVLQVHSPYIPVHPIEAKKELKSGFIYFVFLKLKEERLSPYPYQTDCMDYDAVWRRNNRTGPRSQEVCKDWCGWDGKKECRKYEPGVLMVEVTENMCELNSQNQLDDAECKAFCKADCEKLKYSYKTIEIFMDGPEYGPNRSYTIHVILFIDDPQVPVMSHIPLYDAGDLFSHIGGLMGCWLGVSVAAFTGILESSVNQGRHAISKLWRYFRCRFQPHNSRNISHQRNNLTVIY